MKTDDQIQEDVISQLKWEPFLKSSEIGVFVKNGVVTLSGQVDTYSKKLAAEKAVRKISGVKAVAEDIHVAYSPPADKTDTEIAEAVVNVLKWHTAVQQEKIQIKVEDGFVTLTGEVDWEYQRSGAVFAIADLSGIKGINNFITVKPVVVAADIKGKIRAALERNASIDALRIAVEISGHTVILKGKVRSLAEKDDAKNAAWGAPGVSFVEDRLEVEVDEPVFSS